MNDSHTELNAYLDGELSIAEMERVRSALNADPNLARQLDEIRSISKALRASEPIEVRGLEQTLSALQHRRASRAGNDWRAWGFALSGIAAVMVGAYIVFPRTAPIGSPMVTADFAHTTEQMEATAKAMTPAAPALDRELVMTVAASRVAETYAKAQKLLRPGTPRTQGATSFWISNPSENGETARAALKAAIPEAGFDLHPLPADSSDSGKAQASHGLKVVIRPRP